MGKQSKAWQMRLRKPMMNCLAYGKAITLQNIIKILGALNRRILLIWWNWLVVGKSKEETAWPEEFGKISKFIHFGFCFLCWGAVSSSTPLSRLCSSISFYFFIACRLISSSAQLIELYVSDLRHWGKKGLFFLRPHHFRERSDLIWTWSPSPSVGLLVEMGSRLLSQPNGS